MAGLFVTSTGTGIGKTFVSAGLIRYLRAEGRTVEAFKPVISGFDPAHVDQSDTGILLAALGLPANEAQVERISPWRFAEPLSPDMAAARENRAIDFDALVDFSRSALTAANDATIIEGAGGIMVPLDRSHTVLDWMKAIDLPVLLVAGSYLGSISHTLSAAAVLRQHGCKLAMIVVSETEGSSVNLDETAGTISRFARDVGIVALPRKMSAADADAAFGFIADSCGLL
ncbi:MAG: dethiobiotin synthase [Pseudorhodoplanes sp.]|jgi:dethiobiotin synthetase|nr:dethiobiotin synthase [Pseudorhodoplanes sp.]